MPNRAFYWFLAILLAAFVVASLYGAARAAEFQGRASVVDADTITIGGKNLRLWAIDAPESGQRCRRKADGVEVRCGKDAAFALADKIGAAVVACTQKGSDLRWKRPVVVCRLGRVDLNGWLVEQGHAIAYHDNATYRAREAVARRAERGIWQTEFVKPWDWRRGIR